MNDGDLIPYWVELDEGGGRSQPGELVETLAQPVSALSELQPWSAEESLDSLPPHSCICQRRVNAQRGELAGGSRQTESQRKYQPEPDPPPSKILERCATVAAEEFVNNRCCPYQQDKLGH